MSLKPHTPGVPNVVFVLGGPGAGKSTQCAMLAEQYQYHHVSTGDVLRQEMREGTRLGQEARAYVDSGKLVPCDLIIKIIEAEFRRLMTKGSNFLLDGFPRSFSNLHAWRRHLEQKAVVNGCLFFDAKEEVMEQRMLAFGGRSGRSDDNVYTIRNRFKTFYDESMPLVQEFERVGLLHYINSNKSVEQVYALLQRLFNKSGQARRKDFASKSKSGVRPTGPPVPLEPPVFYCRPKPPEYDDPWRTTYNSSFRQQGLQRFANTAQGFGGFTSTDGFAFAPQKAATTPRHQNGQTRSLQLAGGNAVLNTSFVSPRGPPSDTPRISY
eukprot:TRINITY_DN23089_c0_g1_i1.p1 TRINITY_DN23089_c0_g1~~TRINITY_DN23089_c0_g1_i1.p1  ORF type:complete len:324 (-),score=49.29 TRINITY_DN23089_c0_g1_i1:221-1192(-)